MAAVDGERGRSSFSGRWNGMACTGSDWPRIVFRLATDALAINAGLVRGESRAKPELPEFGSFRSDGSGSAWNPSFAIAEWKHSTS